MIGGTIVFLLVILGVFLGFYSVKNSFRRVLPAELSVWLKDGIISEEQGMVISRRYDLDKLREESQATLINAIFIFGAVLIAGGVVAFVAAHWEGIPRFWKLFLIISIMLAVDWAGFYFWKIRGNLPRLGHALVLLGSLIFGANIALIAQIFHLTADFYHGFLIWTIGALVMAYVVNSIPHAVLAIIASFIWFIGWLGDNPTGIPVYPFALLLAFLPFAFRWSVRGVHFLALLGWGVALITYLLPKWPDNSPVPVILSALFLGLSYWGYANLPLISRNQEFQYDSKFLGVLTLSVVFYIISFHQVIEMIIKSGWKIGVTWSIFLIIVCLVSAIVSIIYGYYKAEHRYNKDSHLILSVITMILVVTIPFAGVLGLLSGTIISNIGLIILGAFLFRFGLNELDRRFFWLGLGLLVLEIVSRFLEYETGLLWKSLAFVVSGLILIFGGLRFEKKYRKRVIANE